MEEGYQQIIGIRDVHPKSRSEIQRIREGFKFRLPIEPIQPTLILGLMEVEAWFLAEHSHFPRIHSALTTERIQQEFGFDPVHDAIQLRYKPAKDLSDIYFLEQINYDKRRNEVERTVNFLDFSVVQNKLIAKFDDLGNLVMLMFFLH